MALNDRLNRGMGPEISFSLILLPNADSVFRSVAYCSLLFASTPPKIS